jgi:hypothetical protein
MQRLVHGLIALALPSGCAEPVPPAGDARFAQASEEQLWRVYSATFVADMLGVAIRANWDASQEDRDECPAIRHSGTLTVVTGGCEYEDVQHLGTTRIHNVEAPFSDIATYDPSQPSLVEYDATSIISPRVVRELDGSVRWGPRDEHGVMRSTSELSVRDTSTHSGDVRSHTSGESTCDRDNNCTLLGTIAIDGLGDAPFATYIRAEDAKIVLRGADVLTFDLDALTEECVPWSVDDGPSGELCEPPEP